jgi:cellulose synthase/poly-beta-1,6-N-acetylglucosamine synthase-like glycosyltransferase
MLFQEYGSSNTNDFFILTDGDVYVSKDAINEIIHAFNDPRIGCLTGKPVSLDNKTTKYGYWANMFFDGIDRVRTNLSSSGSFLECSGYLFAIRKGVIADFPLQTSEDSIIPYLFYKKGYKIGYVPKAQVFVKNPANWEDFVRQKVRNIKAHENLNTIAPDMPRTKSFFNEIRFGLFFALTYPRSCKESIWTIQAMFARLYIYVKAFSASKKKGYTDGWRAQGETNSTKTLDA